MKRMRLAVFMLVLFGVSTVFAQTEEPTVYVIKKGDTLWGLSGQFLSDPFYWPNLWGRNQVITNPHFIFPGQKVKVYPDRIVIEEAAAAKPVEEPQAPQAASASKAPAEQPAEEKVFRASGAEGFLLEKDMKPAGFIIATNQNRHIVGEDDVVYTDVGKDSGAKVGQLLTVYRQAEAVSHPVTNVILGHKIIPLGAMRLSEVEDKVSRGIITESYLEISPGSYLMPYRERRRDISLKAADRELAGYIVDTQMGNKTIAAGDIVFLDMGKSQGVVPGNLLYVVRNVVPDQQYVTGSIDKLPVELLGAVVVVGTGENTSTALVVKSIDAIYRGDMVELRKSK
jgi:hypothetical protein